MKELHKIKDTHCFEYLGELNENITKIVKLLQEYEQSCKHKLDIAVKALEDLGHYGIDFGYGPYRCNVAEVAQVALKSIKEEG